MPKIKLKNILFSTIILLGVVIVPAKANLQIATWKENSQLTATGKLSEVLIKGSVVGLKKNYYQTSFSFIFDPRQNIKITKVISDNLPAKYSFDNNELRISFFKNKQNGDDLSIYISYEETYEKIHEFLRQEFIYIPSFAAGANATVLITFPWEFESATLNNNLVKGNNSFIYNKKVPDDGVRELIKLTLSRNIWDVAIKDSLSSNQVLKNIEISSPIYFKDGGQRVNSYSITSSINPIHQSILNNRNIFKYGDTSFEKQSYIKTKALIATGKYNRNNIINDPRDYLAVTASDKNLLSGILEQIRNSPKYQDFPLYAKIGKFVHDFIKYDISYVGKEPGIGEIIQNPIGVCTEYASLYNALARIAGIPSIKVYGAAYGEYNKFEGHAWNLIYYNNHWFYVDPTWDLMSGIVSSSHIYFNNSNNEGMEIKSYGDGFDFKVKKDFVIKRIQ